MSSVLSLRHQFPLLDASVPSGDWIYFDNAATSHKPLPVIESAELFYRHQNANVHRGSYALAASATTAYEAARGKVAKFINANTVNEIVFTKGATESINLLAHCLAQTHLKAGDEIVLSALEHHANIVPWQLIAERCQLMIKVIPVDQDGVLDLSQLDNIINERTAVVSVGHVSNAFGNINPVEKILARARQVGAISVLDGAQAISHFSVDVQQLDCDFYLFSGHKMFAPTGVGVLYGKYHLLNNLPPYQSGGEMIKRVSFSGTTFQPAPLKFEPGTPNIQGVLGLSAALDWLTSNQGSDYLQHEQQLYAALCHGLREIEGLRLWGDIAHSVPLISFTIDGVHHQDVAELLAEQHIAIRSGHHCAMPAMQALGIDGTIRVSLAIYNQLQEVERFIRALKQVIMQIKHPQTFVDPPESKIAVAVGQAQGWDEKYRQIMLAGKSLTKIDDDKKTPEYEISGCESQVWLEIKIQQGKVQFNADSNSKIVRGLLALIFEALNAQSQDYIQLFDLPDYLQQLGLSRHLSPSRSNGLLAVIQHIHRVVSSDQSS
ncbi:SufS family cysteine desulfurase [Neptunicella sp.]|uniref:SufS family cysteine desulfurase n=1 Tax=Neptunicella sp. TaxID=2125986 RepID=UPI003F6910C5